MPAAQTAARKPFRRGSSSSGGGGGARGARKSQGEVVKTIAFDSIGPRKYALQIRKASNGNPCLKIVEGVPNGDGTFMKFHVTVWSEDFERFFSEMDQLRAYIAEHNIRTPENHKYDPNRKPRGSKAARK